MRCFRLTLHFASGDVQAAELVEGHYSVGSGAEDQIQLSGDGIGAAHVRLGLSGERLQVVPAFAGVAVNGDAIEELVEVGLPVSVELPGVTLVLEALAEVVDAQAVEAAPTLLMPSPAKPANAPAGNLEVTLTIPAGAPRRPPVRTGQAIPVPARSARRGERASESVDEPNKALVAAEYELVQEIARGGMGRIYFGEDLQLKRQVAIKVSSLSEGGIDPRFAWEAEVLAQLAHPNIVPIYTIGADGRKRPFYAMKLVKGRTLQAILNDLKRGDLQTVRDFPLSRLLTIYRKVCDAMAFAHSKGFLHRDLKPENVMVGEFGEVLVMDWGLAKRICTVEERTGSTAVLAESPSDLGMTMEGDVMGTPQYMSPEQAEGMVAGLDERSDLYSLGGILYAILTLRPPIDGKSLDEVLTKVKSGGISAMVTQRGGKENVPDDSPAANKRPIPRALQAVTLKAMALEREQRYASVQEFAADIEAYQNGFATEAEEAGALKLLLLFIRRNKAVSSVVALFVVAAVLFTVKLVASEKTARRHERKALAQMEASRRAAAEAQMSLAEAAEAASDSETLKKALDAVPEDLRTLDWNYFHNRIDTANFSIEAPKGMEWVGFDDWPSQPERMVAVRSDGEVFSLNVNTGTLQSLWRFNPQGVKLRGAIGVSRDDDSIALIYANQTGNPALEIHNLVTGERLGGFQTDGPNNRLEYASVALSGNVCLLRAELGVGRTWRMEVWDWREGKRLWNLDGFVFAELSADRKAVLVNDQGRIQKRQILSGAIITTGAFVGRVNKWYPWSGAGTSDWKEFLAPLNGSSRIRKVEDPEGRSLEERVPL
jgi:serine/threonine protein kinase